jgi:hypothetical protein
MDAPPSSDSIQLGDALACFYLPKGCAISPRRISGLPLKDVTSFASLLSRRANVDDPRLVDKALERIKSPQIQVRCCAGIGEAVNQ